jgi:hypothetical protein
MKAESAITAATTEATVVKYPKTFCTLFSEECIATTCEKLVVGELLLLLDGGGV